MILEGRTPVIFAPQDQFLPLNFLNEICNQIFLYALKIDRNQPVLTRGNNYVGHAAMYL